MLNQTLYSYTKHYPPEILLSLQIPFLSRRILRKRVGLLLIKLEFFHAEIYIQVTPEFLHVLDFFLNKEFEEDSKWMHMIVLNIISYQCIVHTWKSKDKISSLKGLIYRQEVCTMVRLEYPFVLLVYVLCSIQRADGKEIPAPISDVIKRLEDLEKLLLIQERSREAFVRTRSSE